MTLLPRTIVIDGAWGSPSSQADWMHSTLRPIAAEGRELRPGGEAVITWLSDILVIHAIRSWIVSEPGGPTGWLGALQDPASGRKAAFSRAFKRTIGTSPGAARRSPPDARPRTAHLASA
jgi:hypothetical protein